MGRRKQHETSAERQRAYRERRQVIGAVGRATVAPLARTLLAVDEVKMAIKQPSEVNRRDGIAERTIGAGMAGRCPACGGLLGEFRKGKRTCLNCGAEMHERF